MESPQLGNLDMNQMGSYGGGGYPSHNPSGYKQQQNYGQTYQKDQQSAHHIEVTSIFCQ